MLAISGPPIHLTRPNFVRPPSRARRAREREGRASAGLDRRANAIENDVSTADDEIIRETQDAIAPLAQLCIATSIMEPLCGILVRGPIELDHQPCSTQRKSTTYVPIGTSRLNLTPASAEPRSERHNVSSAPVILRLSRLAKVNCLSR